MRKIVTPLMLLLLASLTLAGVARATIVDPGVPGVALPVETELFGGDEEDEGAEDEWEEDEEEGEAEDEEWEAWEDGGEPPLECLLRSVSAKAVVPTGHGKLRLTIRYTAFAPTATTVNAWLQGGKGSLRLPPTSAHLGENGVLHIVHALSEADAERASAAHDFTLHLRVPAAPRECRPLFTRHLKPGHTSKSRVAWQQTGSIFGGP